MTTKTKSQTNGSAPQEGPQSLELPAPKIVSVNIHVEGVSSLICHRWTEKAKKQILDKHMKKAQKGHEVKNPQQDYEDSLYRTEDGYGFPAVAFKAAAIRAGKQLGLVMADLRTWFHVSGELVEINGEPRMREDMVRVQQTTDIRYRGEFPEWSAAIPVLLDESKLSVEQLVNLFTGAGFGVGVGEWRPEKNGDKGRFRVTKVERA